MSPGALRNLRSLFTLSPALAYRFNFMKLTVSLLLLGLLLAGRSAVAQRLILSGQVVEAESGEPVPFASVFVPRTSTGVTADLEGKFKLAVSTLPDSLAASALGFAVQRKRLGAGSAAGILFRLKKGGGVALGEVVVRPGENPAFRILREVQRHKPSNERAALAAAEFDSYNRIEVSLADIPKALANRRVVKDIRALAVRRGLAAAADADAPLPLFASEVGSRVYQKYGPLRRREDILHKQMRGAGPREGSVLSQMLGSNFQNFDFYPELAKHSGQGLYLAHLGRRPPHLRLRPARLGTGGPGLLL